MMKNLIAFAFSAFLLSCAGAPKTEEKSFIDENIDFARAQIGNEIGVIEASGKCLNPVTLKTDSSVYYCGYADWRSGFFPGSVWYLYELTGDSTLLPLAAKYTDAIEEAKNLTWHHDIGFIVNCSFGNGLRLAGTPSYKDVMVQAAKSLSTRFRPAAGIIQSWDVERGWQSERGWECPVIIDNMMNLELMFEATRLSGDSSFYKIAVSHADRTMEEHFRPDGSCSPCDLTTVSKDGQSAPSPDGTRYMPTNLSGVAGRHGLSTVMRYAIVKPRTVNIWIRP